MDDTVSAPFSSVRAYRIFALQPGDQGAFVPHSAIEPDAIGELREGGRRWYGRDSRFSAIVASLEPLPGPAYALVSDCTPNYGNIEMLGTDAAELIDAHRNDTWRAFLLTDPGYLGERIVLDWTRRLNLSDHLGIYPGLYRA